jgi:hypothetical protein
MSKKQSSIEWLEQQFNDPNIPNSTMLFEQAKQLHKQEIIDANRDGVDMIIEHKPYITGEEYYNNTFKQE